MSILEDVPAGVLFVGTLGVAGAIGGVCAVGGPMLARAAWDWLNRIDLSDLTDDRIADFIEASS
jgi:hypothetical protein